MSNLMPEKRLDKNNRLVTRHVKTGEAVPGAGRIPGPQIVQRDVAADRQLVVFASPKYRPTFMEQVKLAPQELVHQINEFYERHKESGNITREIADQTMKIVQSAKKTRDSKRYIELLDTHFDFLASIGYLGSDGVSLVNGLIDVQDRVRKNKGTMTEHEQQAVMKVTKAMVYENSTVDRINDFEFRLRSDMEHMVLSDEDLINMVVERPDQADMIAEMVSQGVIRAGQIKAALDDDIQQPLLGGAL
jgi:hypothetical protein